MKRLKLLVGIGLLMLGLTAFGQDADNEPGYKIDSIDLVGNVVKDNISFTLTFKVKTDGPLDLSIVRGDLTELKAKAENITPTLFLAGEAPKILFKDRSYVLHCPEKGEYQISFEFACKVITGKNGKDKMCRFNLLSAIARNLSITFDTKQVDLAVTDALNLNKEEHKDGNAATFTAILPPSGVFGARWRRHIEKLEVELVTSAKSYLIAEVLPGTVRMHSLFNYSVIQGKLSKLDISISPDLNILNVRGPNIQDWQVVKGTKTNTLQIRLSREYEDTYALGIEAEKILSEFPCKFSLPSINPAGVLRLDGNLAFGTSRAVKLLIDKVSGMSQVDNRSFPMKQVLNSSLPSRSLFTYKFSGEKYALSVNADNIVPSFVADASYILNFRDEDVQVKAVVGLDIKDAPLQELLVRYDNALTVNRVDGAQIVPDEYEPFTKEGQKWLRIPFRPNTIGKATLNIQFEQALQGKSKISLPGIYVDKAKSMRGFLLLAAGKGLSLETSSLKSLREVHTGSAPIRVPGLQLAFRFKDQLWAGEVAVKHEKISIVSQVFHVDSIGEGTVYGSSLFTYHISGAPLNKLRYTVDPSMKNLEFAGRSIVDWKKISDLDNGRQVWELNLKERILGDFDVLATYEISLDGKQSNCKLGAISTDQAEIENGFIVIASLRNLKITEDKDNMPEYVHSIDHSEIPRNYRKMVSNPVLKAYRCLRGPHWASAKIESYDSVQLLDIIVDHCELTTTVDRNGQAETHIEYRIKNSSRQFLALQLPGAPYQAELRQVTVDGKKERLSISNGRLLIPLPRHQDVNAPIKVSVTYGQQFGAFGSVHDLPLVAPKLDVESMLTRWHVSVPNEYTFIELSSNMATQSRPVLSGVTGVVHRIGNVYRHWVRSLLIIPWLMVSLAGILLAWSWGRKKLRIISTVVGVLLLLVSLIALAYSLDHYNPFPRVGSFPTSSASFTRIFSLPEDTLSLNLSISDMRGFSVGKLGLALAELAIAVVGGFLAIKANTKWRRALLAGIAVTLVLAAGAQWLYINAVVAFVAAIALPIMLSIGLCILLFKRARIAAMALLVIGCLCLPGKLTAAEKPRLDAVSFDVKVTEKGVEVAGQYELSAQEAGKMTILTAPAVIVGKLPENEDLEVTREGDNYVLDVKNDGEFKFSLSFLLPHQKANGQISLSLPVPRARRNQVRIGAAVEHMDIRAVNAVSFTSAFNNNRCSAEATFVPGDVAEFILSPQVRNVEEEKTQFFANIDGIVRFASGFVEIRSTVDLKIAQGETSKFVLTIPANQRVTAVTAPDLGAWRYEDASNRLDIMLSQPHHGDFRMEVTTQIANQNLPYGVEINGLTVHDASRQHGSLGLFADPSIQIHLDKNVGFNEINISDFALGMSAGASSLKKALRFVKSDAALTVKATAVEPELRVNEKTTVNFEEERTTLSAELTLDITKAGVFSVMLELPKGFEIDKLSGKNIQHWDEVVEGESHRVIINFAQRILGKTGVVIGLSKMGNPPSDTFAMPRISVVGAKRETGALTVLTERGTRMEVVKRQGLEAVTATFRKKLGANDNIHNFNIHRPDWFLNARFNVAEPWIQVENLHIVRIIPGEAKCESVMNYQIDNAGIKRLRLKLPDDAEAPEFLGSNIVGSIRLEDGSWEVELHRKIVGNYRLMVKYRLNLENTDELKIGAVEAVGSQRQTGYLAVFSESSQQVAEKAKSGEISTFDARKVPASFRVKDLANAVLCYRTVGKEFSLETKILRHKTAETLGATISSVTLDSVISPDGMIITRANVILNNGDENFLKMNLPTNSNVWAAHVDGKPVDLATEGQQSLVPLAQSISGNRGQALTLVYSVQPPKGWTSSSQQYLGPLFPDLPLRNVKWSLHLPENYNYDDFSGSLDYVNRPLRFINNGTQWQSINTYDASNTKMIDDNRNRVQQLLVRGKQLASVGRDEEAQEALNSAYVFSGNDYALNKDVQGQLLETQRAQTVTALANLRTGYKKQKGGWAPAKQPTQPNLFQNIQQAEQEFGGEEVRTWKEISDKQALQQRAAINVPQPLAVTIPWQGKVAEFERQLQAKGTPIQVKFDAETQFFNEGRSTVWIATAISVLAWALIYLLISSAFSRKSKAASPQQA